MQEKAMKGFDLQREADHLLVARYAPASAVVDADLEILHVRGHTGSYLELAPGQANLNLLTMTHEALRPSLAAAIEQARQQGTAVKHERIAVISTGKSYDVTLEVIPLQSPFPRASLLVVFQETPAVSVYTPGMGPADNHPDTSIGHGAAALRIATLEEEVATTRAAMAAALEERDAANEELQTANEEIRASNEELQVINEELITANLHLQTANEQIRAAQEYAEAIVQTVREPLVVLSHDLQIERANTAFYQFFQVTPQETEEHSLSNLGGGQWDSAPLRVLLEGVLTANQPFSNFEVEATFPTIGHKVLLLNARPLSWEGTSIPRVLLAMEDLTERRRLEQIEQRVHAETEARLAMLQRILDELPSSVYLVRGPDARLVLANRASATLWGASWPSGQPMAEFLTANGIRIFGVDGRPLPPAQFATLRTVGQGETVRQLQEVIRHPDGTTLPVLVNAVALEASHLLHVSSSSSSAGDPASERELAAIVVHQDVSALKEAERLKDEFLSIAAHELRTPLAVLKGFAQTLLVQTGRGHGPQLADWQTEALEDIDVAVGRLDRLTEDLLDVARLQAGRIVFHREPTDLVALTLRVVTQRQLTTERHMLSFQSEMEQILVAVDRGRIEQVLSNLLSNAIKYSPEGGSIAVTLGQEDGANAILLSVRDHGIGIPAREQARLFGRFVRAENAQGLGGTGLGLYLCRELIEWHGGRIWFASTEGAGSTFFISLPLASDAPRTRLLFTQ
jgi:signal transduction histidine kinase